jgi:hypothetical protein
MEECMGLTGVGVDVDEYRGENKTCQNDDQWSEQSQFD